MEYAGAVSGAALGYIHDNWKGAYKGAVFGYNAGLKRKTSLSKNSMPAIKRRRVEDAPSRRGSVASRASSRSSGMFGRMARMVAGSRRSHPVRISRGGGTSASASVVVKKKAPKMKRVKRVKVSKKLTKAVKQIVQGRYPNGFFQETHTGAFPTSWGNVVSTTPGQGVLVGSLPGTIFTSLNKQAVFGRTTNTEWSFEHFTFNEVMDAMAVLWLNKLADLHTPYSTNPSPAVLIQNTESRPLKWPIEYIPTVSSGILDSEFRLINCSSTYKLRNNTQRTLKLKYYSCTPRKYRAPRTEDDGVNLAVVDWFDGMRYENQGINLNAAQTVFPSGLQSTQIVGGNATWQTPFCQNQTGNTPNTLRMSPNTTEYFRRLWKTGMKVITLEPGQTHTFVVNGPRNVMVKPKQWLLNDKKIEAGGGPFNDQAQALNYAKYKPGFSRADFFVVEPDLLTYTSEASNNTISSSYVWDNAQNINNGIAVECIKSYQIEMPEIAATWLKGNSDTTVQNETLRNRKRSIYINNWYSSSPTTGTVERVDAENPVDEIEID